MKEEKAPGQTSGGLLQVSPGLRTKGTERAEEAGRLPVGAAAGLAARETAERKGQKRLGQVPGRAARGVQRGADSESVALPPPPPANLPDPDGLARCRRACLSVESTLALCLAPKASGAQQQAARQGWEPGTWSLPSVLQVPCPSTRSGPASFPLGPGVTLTPGLPSQGCGVRAPQSLALTDGEGEAGNVPLCGQRAAMGQQDSPAWPARYLQAIL